MIGILLRHAVLAMVLFPVFSEEGLDRVPIERLHQRLHVLHGDIRLVQDQVQQMSINRNLWLMNTTLEVVQDDRFYVDPDYYRAVTDHVTDGYLHLLRVSAESHLMDLEAERDALLYEIERRRYRR
jgi:hypothetical protein